MAAAAMGLSLGGGGGSRSSLVDEAVAVYRRIQERQRAGDWAGYGEEMKRLGETLERLRAQQGR